jgi:uncharacterized protein YutE (UPF0331/DUF86 family)
MGRAGRGRQASGRGGRLGQSKNQKRIALIMSRLPAEREALLTAMEAFGTDFNLDALRAAESSADPVERLKVAALERVLERLINWLHELAEMGLAEGRRLGTVKGGKGRPWERLAALGVISSRTAQALETVRNMRNVLGHAYPTAPRILHSQVESLMRELDPYTAAYEEWAIATAILPPQKSGA